MLMMGLFFAEKYRKYGEVTIPGIIEKLLGINARTVSSCLLIFVMLVAFVDVIIAKIFGSSIKLATEVITYCDVPLAYLGMGYTLLIGQMTSVDILFGKFPVLIQNILNMVYDAVGMGVCIFLGKLSVDNTIKLFASNTLCNPKGGFPVWPFAAVESLSWFILAIAFLFCLLRFLFRPAGEGKEGEV